MHDGRGFPDIRHFTAYGLVSGRPYRFYVQAVNFVGTGSPSAINSIYACDPPSAIEAPFLNGQVSSIQVPIAWVAPQNNGGCQITSFAILRNSGPETPFDVIE